MRLSVKQKIKIKIFWASSGNICNGSSSLDQNCGWNQSYFRFSNTFLADIRGYIFIVYCYI
jgi:hypothetical protein